MKSFLAVVFFALAAQVAIEAQANTLIFRDGACRGSGVLNPSVLFVSDLKFRSERTLNNGSIHAKSTLSILGIETVVTANLFFEQLENGKINVRDLDQRVN